MSDARALQTWSRHRKKIDIYVNYYNRKRLHGAIGYVAPEDKLSGRADEIHAARDEKLRLGREKRRLAVETEREEA